MSQSWHDFLFGAFDPAGTITVDKLPGSMWVQALSARIFGFHEWAILAPSAVEGALTVLVLYHCVRRLGGPLAGLGAVVILAASPATVTLNRGNIPDSLMILLLVLAADATVSAILNDRWLSAVLAAVYVALAFQAKMVEAWLVLPALGLAYLVAGRGSTVHRIGRLVAMGATVAVVSLSYMTFVALTPASQRPYADGSPNNSLYHQVFVYNGFNRVGQASPNQLLGQTLGTRLFSQAEPPPVWNRLFAGSYGHDTGWLLLAALVALAWILVQRRRAPRTDLVRAGALLWGVWLVVLGVVFTVSTTMNSYYAGALSPAVASLLGLAGALAWEHRHESAVAARDSRGGARHDRLHGLAAARGRHRPAVVVDRRCRGARPGGCRGPRRAGRGGTTGSSRRWARRRRGRARRGRRSPRARRGQRVGRGRGAGSVRHAVPAGPGDGGDPWRLRATPGDAGDARSDRAGAARGALPHGDADVGGGGGVHLRHGRGGPPPRRLHGNDPLADGVRHGSAGRGQAVPPGARGVSRLPRRARPGWSPTASTCRRIRRHLGRRRASRSTTACRSLRRHAEHPVPSLVRCPQPAGGR